MIGRTNAGGGGLNIKDYAISVSFPVGSTCTCTSGSTVYTAKTGAGGAWIFDKVVAGTWTVKITSGSKTASKSVTLSTSAKTAHLDMGYRVYVIESGKLASGITTSMSGGDSNTRKIVQAVSYSGVPCLQLYSGEATVTFNLANITVPSYATKLTLDIKYLMNQQITSGYIDIGGVRYKIAYRPGWTAIVLDMDVSAIKGQTVTLKFYMAGSNTYPATYIASGYFE